MSRLLHICYSPAEPCLGLGNHAHVAEVESWIDLFADYLMGFIAIPQFKEILASIKLYIPFSKHTPILKEFVRLVVLIIFNSIPRPWSAPPPMIL